MQPAAKKSRSTKRYKLGALVGLCACLGLLAVFLDWPPVHLNQWINQWLTGFISYSANFSPWLVAAFLTAAAMLFLPVTPFELLAGLAFGPLWGTCYMFLAGFLAAMCSFMLTRFFLSHHVERVLTRRSCRIHMVKRLIEAKGWRAVALLRLSTFVPFGPLNYVLGLTRICVWDYTWASAVFMVPPTALYVYVGSLGQEYLLHPEHHLLLKVLPLLAIMLVLAIGAYSIKKQQSALIAKR